MRYAVVHWFPWLSDALLYFDKASMLGRSSIKQALVHLAIEFKCNLRHLEARIFDVRNHRTKLDLDGQARTFVVQMWNSQCMGVLGLTVHAIRELHELVVSVQRIGLEEDNVRTISDRDIHKELSLLRRAHVDLDSMQLGFLQESGIRDHLQFFVLVAQLSIWSL